MFRKALIEIFLGIAWIMYLPIAIMMGLARKHPIKFFHEYRDWLK